MNKKSILLAVLLLVAPLHASSLLRLSDQPLISKRCSIVATGQALDLVLLNDGYFVVSRQGKDSELLFTRSAGFGVNSHDYIVNPAGDHLLGINKKSDPTKLIKLKIIRNDLPPKKTGKVNIIINLPSAAANDVKFTASTMLYDSISKEHALTVDYTKTGFNTWGAQVSIDNIKLDKGTLIFDATGELTKQEGLSHIQWSSDYGLNELKIDHSGSTFVGSPFSIRAMTNDGHSTATLIGLEIDLDGTIFLRYNNGQARALKHSIAVAKFLNPDYLEKIKGSRFYKSTEKSGLPRLHKLNASGSVYSGYLEEDSCIDVGDTP